MPVPAVLWPRSKQPVGVDVLFQRVKPAFFSETLRAGCTWRQTGLLLDLMISPSQHGLGPRGIEPIAKPPESLTAPRPALAEARKRGGAAKPPATVFSPRPASSNKGCASWIWSSQTSHGTVQGAPHAKLRIGKKLPSQRGVTRKKTSRLGFAHTRGHIRHSPFSLQLRQPPSS